LRHDADFVLHQIAILFEAKQISFMLMNGLQRDVERV
jgi:hypothetical protein